MVYNVQEKPRKSIAVLMHHFFHNDVHRPSMMAHVYIDTDFAPKVRKNVKS